MRVTLLSLLLVACAKPRPACRVPAPPTLPQGAVGFCGDELCISQEYAEAWSQWTNDMIRWGDIVQGRCNVQDTGRPLGAWKYGENHGLEDTSIMETVHESDRAGD